MNNYYRPCDFSRIVGYPHEVPEKAIDKLPSFQGDNVTSAKAHIMKEFQSIMKNDVWEVVPRPEGKSVVTSKWLFKIKHEADGNVEKHKARFVAKGFS